MASLDAVMTADFNPNHQTTTANYDTKNPEMPL